MPATAEVFRYRPAQTSPKVFPGAHPGRMVSSGRLFKRHEPLIAAPDPRRIDLRASVLDPFGGYKVRVFQQHSVLDVVMAVDLSASMAFSGRHSKPALTGQILASVYASTAFYGDRFAAIGCGSQTNDPIRLPTGRLSEGVVEKFGRLLKAAMHAESCSGLVKLPDFLPRQRSLVFLLSDFHMPLPFLQSLLPTLAQHEVVPLVLWDAVELGALPLWRLVRLQDAEQGKAGTVLLRPALLAKIRQAYDARRRQLQYCFRKHGMEPLFLDQGYQPELLDRYFHRLRAVS